VLKSTLHSGEWNPNGPLGTSATYWPIVPAPGDCEDGEFGGMNGRGNRSFDFRRRGFTYFVFFSIYFILLTLEPCGKQKIIRLGIERRTDIFQSSRNEFGKECVVLNR
jgi:hypothetical protein